MEKRRGLQAPQLNGQPREASSSARSPERRSPERRSPERRSPERRSPPLAGATSLTSLTQTEELFDLIASSQSRRLDEQRASLGEELGVTTALNNIGQLCQTCNPQELNDDFFNMLIKYQLQIQTKTSSVSFRECRPNVWTNSGSPFILTRMITQTPSPNPSPLKTPVRDRRT
ncbi:uncharacterized protein gpsm1a isoform X2 [Brachyhypopomus gauderio]|uniref:uncharacterized protein gpsm1a isoform X2 n=1 Tax=Brachyhypopomus gauderio TaxID=698409 RepID=UPI0040420A95